MAKLHRLVRRVWSLHPHLFQAYDFALVPASDGKPWKLVVAWRWRCRLCGLEITEIVDEKCLPEGAKWLSDG